MKRVGRLGIALCLGLWLSWPIAAQGQGAKAVVVEPEELSKRSDLLGKEVLVDDRGGFQYHNETRMFDEINLRRAPEVEFKLPQRLWTRQSPPAAAVRVQGVLHRDGDQFWVDVSSFEALPTDLERLKRAVALLSRGDVEARESWARWGLRRAEAFAKLARRRDPSRPTGEEAFQSAAREALTEVYRTRADNPPPRAPADYWLDLAVRARADGIPEPEPSAMSHRGLRLLLATARTARDLGALVHRIETLLPNASKVPAEPADLAHWEKPYENGPSDAYRAASSAVRAGLDHRLWAETVRRWLVQRTTDDPKAALAIADEAARLLPEQPAFANGLLERGVAAAAGDVGKLRLAEIETLAAIYRDRIHQPEKAKELYRAWLDDQREHHLSPRDADGRLALAEQYETLVNDRPAAISLLRAAWKIDPGSRELADAFRIRRFKLVNDEWVDSASRPDAAAVATPSLIALKDDDRSPAPPADGALRGLTPDEVRNRLGGKPNRKSLVATRDQVTEQWIYVLQKTRVFVTFARKPSDRHPRVISYYTLPRSGQDTDPAP